MIIIVEFRGAHRKSRYSGNIVDFNATKAVIPPSLSTSLHIHNALKTNLFLLMVATQYTMEIAIKFL